MYTSLCRLDTVDGKPQTPEIKTTATRLMASPPPSRDPAIDISNWTNADVQNWLKENNLEHLQAR